MTSELSFPQRLSKIDDLMRCDHVYLDDSDQCYFLGEYTARMGFAYSATNNLILNFKKSVDRRGRGFGANSEPNHFRSDTSFESTGPRFVRRQAHADAKPDKARASVGYP